MKGWLVSMFLFASFYSSADVFDDLIKNLKEQNITAVSKLVNSNVELNLDGVDGMYSKSQADVILRNFFNANTPKSIVVQHRGSSAQGAKYIIAEMKTDKNNYRMYVFLKTNGTQNQLQELRIEKE